MPKRLLCVLVVLLVAVLSACGASPPPGDAPAPAGSGTFPVTITHAKGTATIPQRPQRVVALGYLDIAVARALGAPLVGVVRYPGGGGNFPGVEPPLPPSVTTVTEDQPNLEQIAALRPDLILMTAARPPFQDAYDRIAAIAPTVTYRTQLLQDDPDELTRTIGRALGDPPAADRLIADSGQKIDGFTARHPEARGRAGVFAQVVPGGLQIVVAPDAPAVRFLSRLGLGVPPTLAAQPTGQLGAVQLSVENIGQLDAADVAFVVIADPATRASPAYQRLALLRSGRLAEVGLDTAFALLQPNPANTAFLLSRIEPTVARLKGA